MTHTIFTAWRAKPSLSALAVLATCVLAQGLSVTPAAADQLLLRRGIAVGENGATGWNSGIISNGEGQGATQHSRFATDGQGNGVAGEGGCVETLVFGGCKGRSATWAEGGSVSGQAGAEFSGEDGSLSSRRTFARDAEGNLTASRSTDAAGENGSYTGDATLEDQTYNRYGAYSGDEGQSATVEGNWVFGSGGSRAVTCTDSTGAVVDCR